MIIDCHTHFWSYPAEITEELKEEMFLMRREYIDPDVSPQTHLKATEKVDRAIVFGLRAPLTGFMSVNDNVAAYVEQYPDRLIGFGSVCPTEENAVEEVDRLSGNLGLRGLKVSPIYGGWDPLDKRALSVFARAEILGLPVMIHQGATFPRKAPLKYANPILLEDIALKFPDLKVVIAHMGHPWEAETIVLIRKQPNFYADISALFYRQWQFYNTLRLAVEYGVTHKLLFGTDFPAAGLDESIRGLHDVVRMSRTAKLPEIPADLPDEIIHRDSLKLLGLE